jgi:hypothetical protein
MERPNFEKDGYDRYSYAMYIEKLEEYCDYLEDKILAALQKDLHMDELDKLREGE